LSGGAIYRKKPFPATKAINRSVTCEGVFDKAMPEDDWKKDDFKAVADVSKAVAELCLEKFLADLDITRAAPLVASVSTDATPDAMASPADVAGEPTVLANPAPETQE
jgi:hypothetical protein